MERFKGDPDSLVKYFVDGYELIYYDKTFTIDEELQALGVTSNRRLEILDARSPRPDKEKARTARRILERQRSGSRRPANGKPGWPRIATGSTSATSAATSSASCRKASWIRKVLWIHCRANPAGSRRRVRFMVMPHEANPCGNGLRRCDRLVDRHGRRHGRPRHCGMEVVTAGMDSVSFKAPVRVGDHVVVKA